MIGEPLPYCAAAVLRRCRIAPHQPGPWPGGL